MLPRLSLMRSKTASATSGTCSGSSGAPGLRSTSSRASGRGIEERRRAAKTSEGMAEASSVRIALMQQVLASTEQGALSR